MTDDERMDRARRIREMCEGSRPDDGQDDEASDEAESGPGRETSDGGRDGDTTDGADDDSPTEGATDGTGDGGRRGHDERGDDTGDAAAELEQESDTSMTQRSETVDGDDTPETEHHQTASGTGDEESDVDVDPDEGGMHIPGADVGDVEVDVEEMARQAGLETAGSEGSDGDGDADAGTDTEASGGEDGDGEDATDAGSGPTVRATSESGDGESTSTMRVLEFALGGESYCLDIEYIEEIVKQETVTRVPNTPAYVEGVVDLRGQITTILDPKVPLDIDGDGSESLIVVFDPEEFEDQGAIGWIVDDVTQVMPLDEEEINKPPIDDEHINGVVDRDGEFVIWTSPDIGLDTATG